MRNFTARAVQEHLRSQLEDTGGAPALTANELDLVRFIRQGGYDWDVILSGRPET